MRYLFASAVLLISMGISFITNIPTYQILGVLSLLLITYLLEKITIYSTYFTILIKKNIITIDDIENLNPEEYFNGKDE
jgi:hypothetical protein